MNSGIAEMTQNRFKMRIAAQVFVKWFKDLYDL